MLICSEGEVCKVMKVANQQIQRGVFRSHVQQLNKWALQ